MQKVRIEEEQRLRNFTTNCGRYQPDPEAVRVILDIPDMGTYSRTPQTDVNRPFTELLIAKTMFQAQQLLGRPAHPDDFYAADFYQQDQLNHRQG
jgi:hypothetical protein